MSAKRWARGSRPRLVGAAVLALLALVGVTMVPRAGTLLIVGREAPSADVTLVTYSVNSFARPSARLAALNAAADRYASGSGPHVLISTYRSEAEEFRSQSELAMRHLLRRGVDPSAIEPLPDVRSEYEEGQAVRGAAAGKGWGRLAALAPDFRSRRTEGTLRRALAGTGVTVLVVSVADPSLDLAHWWRSWPGVSTVAGEYLRLGYYAAAGRL